MIIKFWEENESIFTAFATDGKFQGDLQVFRQNSSQASNLLCSLPIVLANIVKAPIVILTDMQSAAVIPVVPESVCENDIIWMSYQCGKFRSLHRDQKLCVDPNVKKMTTEKGVTQHPSSDTARSCRCGKGAKRKQEELSSCFEYKSKCPCFRSLGGCTDSCSCLGCKNPYGNRMSNPNEVTSSGSRTRRPQNSTKSISGAMFLQSNNCARLPSIWNRFEEFVLHEVVNATADKVHLDTTLLPEIYNKITSSACGLRYGLSIKTRTDVTKKLDSLVRNGSLCRKLILEQAKVNFKAL